MHELPLLYQYVLVFAATSAIFGPIVLDKLLETGKGLRATVVIFQTACMAVLLPSLVPQHIKSWQLWAQVVPVLVVLVGLTSNAFSLRRYKKVKVSTMLLLVAAGAAVVLMH